MVGLSTSTGRFRKQARVMRRLRLLATLSLLLAPATGCSILSGIGKQFSKHEALDDFMVSYRNEAWAAKAWHCRKHRFCNKKYLSDVEAGFRAGYETVAAGGDGCTPSLCPQSYWGWQYQNAEGQARMNAWFEGFPLGVQAAEQDGIGHWSQVRTSMAVPPPVAPAAAAAAIAAPSVTGEGPAEGALSDRSEVVPVPLADPATSEAMEPPVPAPTLSPAETAEPSAGNAVPPALTPAPAATVPELPAAPASGQPAITLPEAKVPEAKVPEVKPPVPQPNADPFGFD